MAFELYTKILTDYLDEYVLDKLESDMRNGTPLIVEGVELDLRMRGFEFFSLVSSHAFDSLRPVHLKATGRIKFQGKVVKPLSISNEQVLISKENEDVSMEIVQDTHSLVGDVSVSGLKLNQLMIAPQLGGILSISHEGIKVRLNLAFLILVLFLVVFLRCCLVRVTSCCVQHIFFYFVINVKVN